MYSHNYIIPDNTSYMYRNEQNNGDRFLLTPFLAGGLAGTALGFGIANNNQINRPPCCGMPPMIYPYPPYIPPSHRPYNNYNNYFYR